MESSSQQSSTVNKKPSSSSSFGYPQQQQQDEPPTLTTTKALLVSIVAPRKFLTKVPAAYTLTHERDDIDESSSSTEKAEEETEETTANKEMPNAAISDDHHYETMKKKESSAPSSSLEPPARRPEDERKQQEQNPEVENANDKEEAIMADDENEDDDDAFQDSDDAVPEREDVDDEESHDEVTAEEAAAVRIGSGNNNENALLDPDSAAVEVLEKEINVEELLRIAFSSLLEEWHLLNVPTYSLVLDKQQNHQGNNDEEQQQQQETEEETKEDIMSSSSYDCTWIRLEVMVRPASLGVILERLERIGVGTNVGTVSVFKVELCRTASPYLQQFTTTNKEQQQQGEEQQVEKESTASSAQDDDNNATREPSLTTAEEENGSQKEVDSDALKEQERLKTERMIEEAKAEWRNAATRLRIEQVREQIVEQSAFAFDFIALLIIASILAGVGLITDNTVVIVASMLVSPIMGPVLGVTFGSRIQDWPLVKTSLRNETLALVVCIIIGVFVGLAAGFTTLAQETWPTNEMEIRGEPTGLLIGICVAIPSGMGVCLSILGGQTSSLVGVAISASLLPPAVNAGICFLYAILLQSGAVRSDSGTSAGEFATIGGISLALTVINILCIWVSGIVMFEIKEVAPIKQKNAFWARDMKVARKLNKGPGDKPPPVDVGIVRKGLMGALTRKQKESEKPIDAVRIRPPPEKKRPFETASLGAAFALQPRRRRPSHVQPAWGSTLNEVNEEVDDNVRYVGLEDMAALLGFDEDDDAVPIDHAAVARNIGQGRYL